MTETKNWRMNQIPVLNNIFFLGIAATDRLTAGKNTGNAGIEAQLDLTDKIKLPGQFALRNGDHSQCITLFLIGPSYESANFHVFKPLLRHNLIDISAEFSTVRRKESSRHALYVKLGYSFDIQRG